MCVPFIAYECVGPATYNRIIEIAIGIGIGIELFNAKVRPDLQRCNSPVRFRFSRPSLCSAIRYTHLSTRGAQRDLFNYSHLWGPPVETSIAKRYWLIDLHDLLHMPCIPLRESTFSGPTVFDTDTDPDSDTDFDNVVVILYAFTLAQDTCTLD